jgi:DNA-binding transcriptional MerR regulator
MSQSNTRSYSAQEFARLAGVTVRALHHYDRLGLLTPVRTAARHRRYTDADLPALEQIVVLKFIGIPLRQIRSLRRQGAMRFVDALRAQRGTLVRKRELLDRAIAAIARLERAVGAGGAVETAIFRQINEVIQMQDNPESVKQQYDDLMAQKVSRLQEMSATDRAGLRSDWAALVEDIRAVLPGDPSSDAARALGVRWQGLLGALMGQPVSSDLLAVHQSQPWSPAMASFVDEPVWTFMQEVFRRQASRA